MATTAYPRLFADSRGVWREDRPGSPYGIEWGEIDSVSGHKLDGITEVYTVVELDWVYGEYVELNDTWDGFCAVVEAITKNVAGIDPNWFTTINSLTVTDRPLIVWQRK